MNRSKTPEALLTSPEQKRRTAFLLALTAIGKHVYEGTVPAAVVARRRAKNKAARIARRAAR